jgi:iron complex outermembrane recepter protein
MRSSLRLLIVVFIAIGMVCVQASHAQGIPDPLQRTNTSRSGDSPEEIVVVTAEMRTQNIQDVALPVTALGGETLRDLGIDTVKLLSTSTPGISISAESSSVVPYIRGIGTQFALPGLESSVAMYMDDIYLSRTSAGFLTFNDIERVEVLKGPQGVLYGRNNTGGAIRLISKDTTPDFHAGVAFSAGEYGMLGGDAYASGPINETLQFRVAAQYTEDNGWLESLIPGAPNMETRNILVLRGKLKYVPGDRLTVSLLADYANQRDTTGLGNLPLFTQAPASVGAALGAIVDPAGREYSGNVGSIDNDANKFRNTMWGSELRADFDLDLVRLTSITGYRYSNFRGPGDLDATSAPLLSADQRGQPTKDFSEEIQAISAPGSKLGWTSGLYYWHERASQKTNIIGIGALPSPNNTVSATGTVAINSFAAYTRATYKVASQWEIQLGGRLTSEHRELLEQNLYMTNEDWMTARILGPIVPTGSQSLPAFNTTQFNPNVGASWRPNEAAMLYVNWSTGFKAGGFNGVGVPQSVDRLRNERISAYELGWKTQFSRFRFNGDYFHYELTDLQVLATTGTGSFLGARNAASATENGVDTEVMFAVNDRLEIDGGLGWLDARFDSFPDGQRYLPCVSTTMLVGGSADYSGNCLQDFGLGLGYTRANLKGNRLPLAPQWTGFLRAGYVYPMGRFGTIAAHTVGSYSDAYSFSADNLYNQPAFWMLNGSLDWKSRDNHFGISLSGTNLTNTLYYTFKNPFQLGGWKNQARPRMYEARLYYTL